MLEQFPVDANDFDGPVLVTGAGGCIGSWVLALLSRARVPVVAFDLSSDKRRPSLLLDKSTLDGLTWIEGDIAKTEDISNAVENSNAKAIIHLAALQVPFCAADPVGGSRVNVVGTVNVFEAARHNKLKRVTYASSVAAHGTPSDSPFLATLYGAYKVCNEAVARVYAQDWGVPSIGLRPSIVYGVGRDQGMSSKPTSALLAAAAGMEYTVPFSGPMAALHAGEVASAFIKAVSKEGKETSVFDINGVSTSVEQWVEILHRAQPEARINVEGAALPFPATLSDEPLREFLGDYGKVDLEIGVNQTLAAFKDLLERGVISIDNLS